MAPIILIDDREKEPYDFAVQLAGQVEVRVQRLPAGDYSLAGQESKVCVERKTFDDYVSTVINHRERFSEQLKLMKNMSWSVIVVESTWNRLVTGPWKTKTSSETLIGITMSILHAWKVPIMFCGDRPGGWLYTLGFLKRASGSGNRYWGVEA
mgnify:CR=1 FL=1